ncbi:hypothetical protein E0Z10_g6788 [Xylaria hypoxylon]|uniref:Uncharacterized protein n=1 Tax=Xylaria hypoxylon TaxID=37992 RepID=A0A4Z0YD95_9PEZI|nr:hypothetical protein E0Z10_g6788 [Xylaria hypoxylon]
MLIRNKTIRPSTNPPVLLSYEMIESASNMAATDTHAPLVQGFVWSITTLSVLFIGLRLYIKWKYRGKLWYDDYILVASVLLLLVNAGLVQRIVVLGYGEHASDILAASPRDYISIIMYLQVISGVVRLSTNLARVSFAATLYQLSNENQKRFIWFAITTLLAVMTPAIIFPFVSCRPYARIFDASIPGTSYEAIAVYTALVDFALVAMPWWILSKLQLRRVEKLGASLALSLGVLSGVVTLVKVSYITRIVDRDWTYLTIWNMVEPASVIIAASVPNMRVFFLKKSKDLKASFRLGSSTHVGSRGKSRKTDNIYLDDVQGTIPPKVSPLTHPIPVDLGTGNERIGNERVVPIFPSPLSLVLSRYLSSASVTGASSKIWASAQEVPVYPNREQGPRGLAFTSINKKPIPYFWLSTCVNQATRQRNFDTSELPDNIKPSRVTTSESGIEIQWSHDTHVSFYSWDFLEPYIKGDRPEPEDVPLEYFGAGGHRNSSIEYGEFGKNEIHAVGRLTDTIRRKGFAFITGVPTESAKPTKDLLEMIAFIRQTLYGGFYVFTPDLALADTAYTNEALPAHFKLPFHASGNEGITISSDKPYPVLELDLNQNAVHRVRWNESDRAVTPLRENTMEWYEARGKFSEILKRKELVYQFQLEPGTVLIFDNWRVLHGRTAFTGTRKICGGYINRDDYFSRWRNTNFSKKEVFKQVIGE